MKCGIRFRIVTAFVTLTILFGTTTSFAATKPTTKTATETVIIQEDFENGFVPNGWSVPEAMLGTFLKVKDGALELSCEDDATIRVSKDFTPVDTVCSYEFKFKTDSSFINFAYTGGTGGVGMFFTLQNNVLTATYGDGSGSGTSQKFVVARGINPDAWTKLKVEIAAIYNMVDPAVTIYVNDKKVLTDVALWQPLKNVSYFWFGMNSKGTLYIDDVKITATGDKIKPVNTAPERSLRRVDKNIAINVIEADDTIRLKTYSDNVMETYIPIVAINPLAENGYHLSQTGVLYNNTDLYFNVPEQKDYIFTMRYGSSATRTLGLNINGVDVGDINFEAVGSNQLRDFSDLSIKVNLKKGENIIRLLGLGKGNVFFECFMLHNPEQIPDGVFTELVSAGNRQYLPVTEFSDIDSHAFSEEIRYCAESGFFKQSSDKFRPDDAITRQEFLEVLLNSLGYSFNSSQEYLNKAVELSLLPEQLSELDKINEPMVFLDARIFFEQINKSGYFRESIPFGDVVVCPGMTCATVLTRGVCAKLFYNLFTSEITGFSYRRQAYLRMIMQKPRVASNARSFTNWSLISLWFGENVKEANEILCDSEVTGMVTYEDFDGGTTRYWTIPTLIRIYYGFNQENGKYGKLLTKRTQDCLLEMMWNFVNVYADHVLGTGLDPNVIQGTENCTWHEMSSIYLASQLLYKDERYKNKVFENGNVPSEYVDRIEQYFLDVFENRAGRGILIEGSATYVTVSTQGIYNLMDFTENPKLSEAAKMFLDIFWIEHGMESLNAVRGGGKAREYIRWAVVYNWAYSSLASIYFDNKLPHMGDYADIETSLLSDYRPPKLAEMLSGYPDKRGRFEAIFRTPGVGSTVRESATGIPMFYHSESESVLRYTYSTPYYVMGSFIYDTSLQYSVLAGQNRWEGVILDDPLSGRIFPRYVSGETGAKAFLTMQKGPIMLGQRGQQRNVEIYVLPYVEINDEGNIDLDEGWYFGQYKDVYYGIKAVSGTLTLSPSKHLLLTDPDSQFIIHMGDREQDGTFEEFCNRLKENEILYDDNEITYTDSVWGSMRFVTGVNTRETRFINGKAVDMNPAKVVDSPYLWGNFAEGKLYTKFGEETLLYDFTNFTVKSVTEGINK